MRTNLLWSVKKDLRVRVILKRDESHEGGGGDASKFKIQFMV